MISLAKANTVIHFSSKELYCEIRSNTRKACMYLGGSVQTLKKIIKGVLLDIQGSGDIEEWLPENNPLFCVAGVRKSARIAKINDNT